MTEFDVSSVVRVKSVKINANLQLQQLFEIDRSIPHAVLALNAQRLRFVFLQLWREDWFAQCLRLCG